VAWEIQSILGALREVRERSEVVKSIRVELLPGGMMTWTRIGLARMSNSMRTFYNWRQCAPDLCVTSSSPI